MAIININNIYKSYTDNDRTLDVLKGISFDIEHGDFVSITGKSGCGKSTLLHIMGLLDKPNQGTVSINGKEIDYENKQNSEIRNRDIGFVFQFHYLIEDLNALENVALPLIIAGISHKQSISRAKNLLEELNLGDRLYSYSNQLSGGEQQRVAIARALINEPKIVLADEPTGNLDPVSSKAIWDMISELNQANNQTFVVVTHDLEFASRAKRLFVLDEGIIKT